MRIDGSTVDLKMSSNGDLIVSNVPNGGVTLISNNMDLEDTSNDPTQGLRWIIEQRITNNEIDWGNGVTDSQKSKLLTLSRDIGEVFYKPCASLDDFLGVQLNSDSMNAIKSKIEEALFLDDALREAKVNVKVVRLTESTINVMVICQVDRSFFSRKNIGTNSAALRGFQSKVIVVTMNYDVADGNLNISSIDLRENY